MRLAGKSGAAVLVRPACGKGARRVPTAIEPRACPAPHRRHLEIVTMRSAVDDAAEIKAVESVPAPAAASASAGVATGTDPLLASTGATPKVVPTAEVGTPEPAAIEADGDEDAKSKEYSETMNRRMGTSLHYRHELGIDYNRILPDLIVGSCLQTPADVDRLADQEGVTTVYCLQEDSDMAYFNLDIEPIQERCRERGDIKHVRFSIRDFDPFDLRRKLPRAVSRLAREHDPAKGGTVYIHCTAGMGRAPAVALAYMNWVRGMQLDEARVLLQSLRRCGPKIEAIRSATSDLLLGTEPVLATIAVHRYGSAQRVQVAGLDVGWNAPLDMHRDPATQRFVLQRKLFPGKYLYKLIVDGSWTFSADHPTALDGTNTNNVLEVIPAAMDTETVQKQVRYLSEGSHLTPAEHAELVDLLCPWRYPGGEVVLGAAVPPAFASSADL